MNKVVLIFLASLLANPLIAGGMTSGGGSAVVCRQGLSDKVDATMLDVFEGRERFKLSIPEDRTSPSVAIAQGAINRIGNQGLRSYMNNALLDIIERIEWLPPHLALHTSSDLGKNYAVYTKAGCAIETAGFYETNGKLVVVPSIFQAMTPVDQAAFYLHEMLYRMHRNILHIADSALAREHVALMLSSSIDSPSLTALMEKTLNGKLSHFILVKRKPGAKLRLEATFDKPEWGIHLVTRKIAGEKVFDGNWVQQRRFEIEFQDIAELQFSNQTTLVKDFKVFYGDELVFSRNEYDFFSDPTLYFGVQR